MNIWPELKYDNGLILIMYLLCSYQRFSLCDKLLPFLWISDFLGNERVKETKQTGEALTESQNINKSLLTLGNNLHCKIKPLPY